MGNYFSSKHVEEDTVKTEDFDGKTEVKTTGGYKKNELNKKILSILNSDTIREGGSDNSNVDRQNINNKIFNILNSIGEFRGGGDDDMSGGGDDGYDDKTRGNSENRYLKYDILKILENLEKEQKGGNYNDFSESSISDLKNKISNIIKNQDGGGGGKDDINDNYVFDILNSEIKNMKGGDCNCKKQTGGRYTSSSSSSSSTDDSLSESSSSEHSSSTNSNSSSTASSSSSDSPITRKKSSKKNKKSSKKNKKINKNKHMTYGGSSSNNSDDKKIGNGISIFPFNSSSMDVSSVSEKHFRLLRRHI